MKNKILIIEDNEQNMYMLSYLLESYDFKVFKSFNGTDGLVDAKRCQPDLILLDIQLPVMDGYEVARKMRQIKGLEKVPIIAVSSFAMPGDKERAFESGVNGYFEKPIDTDTFISRLQDFL